MFVAISFGMSATATADRTSTRDILLHRALSAPRSFSKRSRARFLLRYKAELLAGHSNPSPIMLELIDQAAVIRYEMLALERVRIRSESQDVRLDELRRQHMRILNRLDKKAEPPSEPSPLEYPAERAARMAAKDGSDGTP